MKLPFFSRKPKSNPPEGAGVDDPTPEWLPLDEIEPEQALPSAASLEDHFNGVSFPERERTDANPPTQGRFKKWVRAAKKSDAAPAGPALSPIRLIIGFLPEVTARDIRDYAFGVAEKHFEQIGLAHMGIYAYNGGFAFEVHEGGLGKAYLPEILSYFENDGPFRPSSPAKVVIKTSTRYVQVEKTRAGLSSIILPESYAEGSTDWLQPKEQLDPLMDTRAGFAKFGVGLLATGLVALVLNGLLFRLQPYDPAEAPQVEKINLDMQPSSQWPKLTAVPAGSFVKALRFRNGKWEPPEVGDTLGTSAPTTPATNAIPSGEPPVTAPNKGEQAP